MEGVRSGIIFLKVNYPYDTAVHCVLCAVLEQLSKTGGVVGDPESVVSTYNRVVQTVLTKAKRATETCSELVGETYKGIRPSPAIVLAVLAVNPNGILDRDALEKAWKALRCQELFQT